MKDGEVEHFENCPVRKEKYEEQVIINSFLYCYERHVPRPPTSFIAREIDERPRKSRNRGCIAAARNSRKSCARAAAAAAGDGGGGGGS